MGEEPEPNVGARIRLLREKQGLSLRAVAERCGLSINSISQIERGENSPTVSSLHRLAKAFQVPITDFFQTEAQQTAVFVKCGTGIRSQSNGVLMETLGVGLKHQRLEPFQMEIAPGYSNIDDRITHSGQEFIFCLEGEVQYHVGKQGFHLEQGDSLVFEATQFHAYQNLSSQPATILLVFEADQDRSMAQMLHLEAIPPGS